MNFKEIIFLKIIFKINFIYGRNSKENKFIQKNLNLCGSICDSKNHVTEHVGFCLKWLCVMRSGFV